jgi:hypothetical protein
MHNWQRIYFTYPLAVPHLLPLALLRWVWLRPAEASPNGEVPAQDRSRFESHFQCAVTFDGPLYSYQAPLQSFQETLSAATMLAIHSK